MMHAPSRRSGRLRCEACLSTRLPLIHGSDGQFFRSQFVLESHRVVGLPITSARPPWVSPEDIMHMRGGDVSSLPVEQPLMQVGDLKFTPLAVPLPGFSIPLPVPATDEGRLSCRTHEKRFVTPGLESDQGKLASADNAESSPCWLRKSGSDPDFPGVAMTAALPLSVVVAPPRALDKPADHPPRRVAIDPPAEKFLAEPVPLANYDRSIRAAVARASRGIAWPSLVAAWADWYWHLASAPGKQMELASKAQRKAAKYGLYALEVLQGDAQPCIDPLPQDRRFDDPAWQQPPFNLMYQGFLLMQQWIWNATNHVAGVSRHHERMVTFTARQMLDVMSPSNFLPTNPEGIERAMESGGMNLVQGAHDWWRDALATFAGKAPADGENFRPGHEVAVTPGKVVMRNDLIELIQYTPTTATVYAQPTLIVPSPILKYYILDLSPANSMVRYLVEQGHTVFVISWRNPDARDRELGVDHYLRLGIRSAIDAVTTICDGEKVHAVGYCLGGTFLAMLAASMAGAGDERLASLTLLAAEVDFTEAGELAIFIDDSQLVYLEDMTWEQGYLEGRQMSGAFTLLNSNDLLWSRLLRQYLMAEPPKHTDLTAWNVDTTRLPHRMHTEYLRKLYLNNDLASGRYRYDGRALALSDIRAPVFLVGTEKDHVAPWRSVYMLHLYADTPITFCLTSGGHNVGIVNPPTDDGPPRHFRVSTRTSSERYIDPDQWFARIEPQGGSWWPTWERWLAERSGELTAPPGPHRDYMPMGNAPGTYVLMH